MRFDTDLPQLYGREVWDMPAFAEDRRITHRTEQALENLLYLYSNLALSVAKSTDNNPRNFKVKQVSVVGSAAKENRLGSDLDFLLVVPNIPEQTARDLKTTISYVTFCDRPKNEAVDVYIRSKDAYPERESVDITSQVDGLLSKYNSLLDECPSK